MNAPVEKSLLRWLGLRQEAAKPDENKSSASQGEACSLEEIAQRDLLGEISAFLIENSLAVSDANLLAARAAFSGANPRFARKIAARRIEGLPITQEWLDEVVASLDDEAGRKEEYERLLSRLETGLDVFTLATKSARSAHGEYQTALEKQVSAMEAADTTGLALTSLAEIAKAMIERTRQVEEEMRRSEQEATSLRRSLASAQRDAEIDHLTGLPNRRAFEAVLEREFREAQAAVEPLCIAICDIDHFKRVNDTQGHETGDRVIQAIGQMLARITDDKCHVARHGGEEFVMLFRDISRREAQARLDDAREQMAARRFINRKNDEPIGNITFSGGVADVFAYADCRAALAAADQALYRAKQEGRNRILLA